MNHKQSPFTLFDRISGIRRIRVRIAGIFKSTSTKILFLFVVFLSTFWLFSLPRQLFPENYSVVMYDTDGNLLNARVAADGQWRFPGAEGLPENYKTALLIFEDRFFRFHPGINPFSIARAMVQNIREGEIKSGGSTITMQVVRLSRRGKPRTFREKLIEIWMATRLELRYSKREILDLYAAHAPFGGNVVGLQAASWRYFGHSMEELTWAEAAMLAVLPNSPSLIFPGRNQKILEQKRNRLLKKLWQNGHIDQLTYDLSLLEPIPEAPHPLPRRAPHLFSRLDLKTNKNGLYPTTIQADLQERVKTVLLSHWPGLYANHIHNMAVLVAEVATGQVIAYWGNVPENNIPVKAGDVDIIASERSPGSLLKPFLYAAALQDGQIMPKSLVADIPTSFRGFNPENFTRNYDGAVTASLALSRSLNVPAVRMLMHYHPDKFLTLLQQMGITTMRQPSSHYGLSMILGGGEISMWEIAGVFASMARVLNTYTDNPEAAASDSFHPLTFTKEHFPEPSPRPSPFTPGVIWHTFEAMVEAARPDTEAHWQRRATQQKIAWKTGTSHGFRDAWSVGVNAEHVVAVWAGNATGEGRPGLTGIAAAAPVMFDVFQLLPPSDWFKTPWEDLIKRVICRKSGYPASQACNQTDTVWVPRADYLAGACPWHILIHTNEGAKERVSSDCYPIARMETHSWFVLPPSWAYFYRQKNPFYRSLPPIMEGCAEQVSTLHPMQWIYPTEKTSLYIPMELDGSPGEVVLRIAHREPSHTLFWHLNGNYMGSTQDFHEMAIRPEPGNHSVFVMDDKGNQLEQQFEIKSRTNDPINSF